MKFNVLSRFVNIEGKVIYKSVNPTIDSEHFKEENIKAAFAAGFIAPKNSKAKTPAQAKVLYLSEVAKANEKIKKEKVLQKSENQRLLAIKNQENIIADLKTESERLAGIAVLAEDEKDKFQNLVNSKESDFDNSLTEVENSKSILDDFESKLNTAKSLHDSIQSEIKTANTAFKTAEANHKKTANDQNKQKLDIATKAVSDLNTEKSETTEALKTADKVFKDAKIAYGKLVKKSKGFEGLFKESENNLLTVSEDATKKLGAAKIANDNLLEAENKLTELTAVKK